MIRKKTTFNFLAPAKVLTPCSVFLSFMAVVFIFIFGFSYGIDFAGGNEIQIKLKKETTDFEIRQALLKQNISQAIVQKFGSNQEFLIRLEAGENEEKNNNQLNLLRESLKTAFHKKGIEIQRIDSIGPQMGKELKKNGLLALIYSLLMILIYLSLRFDSKYAPAAVFCLFHDAMITMSLFSLFQLEINVQTLAAILAIIGYSLNDTIVTFDRIRENYQLYRTKQTFKQICNQSLNEVLSRTLLTSVTTLLAISMMYIFADGVIKDFAFTLFIGVLIGTYSSIYVATPLLLFMSPLKMFQTKSN